MCTNSMLTESVMFSFGCILVAGLACYICFITPALFDISDRKTLQGNEELVLNSMATINNLSYYNTSDSAIRYKQMKLAQCMLSPSLVFSHVCYFLNKFMINADLTTYPYI